MDTLSCKLTFHEAQPLAEAAIKAWGLPLRISTRPPAWAGRTPANAFFAFNRRERKVAVVSGTKRGFCIGELRCGNKVMCRHEGLDKFLLLKILALAGLKVPDHFTTNIQRLTGKDVCMAVFTRLQSNPPQVIRVYLYSGGKFFNYKGINRVIARSLPLLRKIDERTRELPKGISHLFMLGLRIVGSETALVLHDWTGTMDIVSGGRNKINDIIKWLNINLRVCPSIYLEEGNYE